MARRAFVPPPTLAPDSTPRASTPPPSRSPSSSGSAAAARLRRRRRRPLRRGLPSGSIAAARSCAGVRACCLTRVARCRRRACRMAPTATASRSPRARSCSTGSPRRPGAVHRRLDRERALGRNRTDPTLAVRLLRAYRETGRIDRARELAASLPSAPASWTPLDAARLAIERAILATIDGRGRPRRSRASARRARARRGARRARASASSSTCTSRRRSSSSSSIACPERAARASPRRARGRAARRRRLARARRDDARAPVDAPGGSRARPPSTTRPPSRAPGPRAAAR